MTTLWYFENTDRLVAYDLVKEIYYGKDTEITINYSDFIFFVINLKLEYVGRL